MEPTEQDQSTITITLAEYQELVKASKELNVLHQMGVDNWDGYEEAIALLENDE
jgi:hypothetical protein